MRDCGLSELEFCDCHCIYHGEPNGCNRVEGECEAYRQYLELVAFEKEIKDRDIIKLPCKIPVSADPYKWQVIWRGSYKICSCELYTEKEADEFLKTVQGE